MTMRCLDTKLFPSKEISFATSLIREDEHFPHILMTVDAVSCRQDVPLTDDDSSTGHHQITIQDVHDPWVLARS
jgi:hypothetical protein